MKIYLSMKTLTDFRKTVETGVDPRLTSDNFSLHMEPTTFPESSPTRPWRLRWSQSFY